MTPASASEAIETDQPPGDRWLDRWLPLVAERSRGAPVLELGCGSGRDSATLVAAGQRVVGIDLSRASVDAAAALLPDQRFHCRDLREPFPDDAGRGVVVASLSLHYFDWPETLALAHRLRGHLRPGGVLLCRLNSTADAHYGAEGHPRIGQDYYLVDGAPKRFFDRDAVLAMFAEGWRMLSLQAHRIDRYERPKALWEAVLERDMEPLAAGQLRLEPLQVGHADALFEVLSDPELHRHLDHPPPPSLAHLREVYGRLATRRSGDGRQHWLNWALTRDGGPPFGYVQATVEPDGSAWIAFLLSADHWGRGEARAATEAMLDHLPSAYGVHRFLAVAEVDNLRSVSLLERLGFRPADAAELADRSLTATERMFVRTAALPPASVQRSS